ncbi:ATP-binding cassette sub- D member 3 [Balamuthia mandrillaris]
MVSHSKLAPAAQGWQRYFELFAKSKERSAAGVGVLVCVIVYGLITRRSSAKSDKKEIFSGDTKKGASSSSSSSRSKVAVDMNFFRRLWSLLKIMIPGPFTPESGYMVLVAFMMLARTWCDVWMLKNGTAIERTIITRDYNEFLKVFTNFILASFPIAVINNLLKYGLSELGLRFRCRITDHLYKEYLKGFTYYQVSNLDNRIANADQLLTQDVEKFCSSVAELYSNISKPILDIFIYARKLTGAIGFQGPSSMLAYLILSGLVLTRMRRPIGRFTVNEQRLEGEFRYVNSRLITNAEEVAFYNGNKKERAVIKSTFDRLVDHLRNSMQFRCLLGVVDSLIAKYLATVVGYLVVSRPFFDPKDEKHNRMTHGELMEDYYKSGRMLMNMAMAVGRLVLAGRELTRLAGYTARVTELQTVLRDLNHGTYQRTMVSNSNDLPPTKGEDGEGEGEEGKATSSGAGKRTRASPSRQLIPNSGKIVTQDHIIKFEDVPVVTPNGDLLIESLNFEVRSGMNVLVCGPNGCGKSSLFRILGELWPLFGGVLTKPEPSKLFYIPQRPYLALGTLRDQVIYPHSKKQMQRAGLADEDLVKFLEQVHLGYLVEREGGWDAVQDWADVLSGGEKQRVAMARLFYHCPQFAILDECTSAVSVDVEGFMYEHCRELGITLFTVSHRKSLWKHHEYVLQFDGRGAYEFKKIEEGNEYGS